MSASVLSLVGNIMENPITLYVYTRSTLYTRIDYIYAHIHLCVGMLIFDQSQFRNLLTGLGSYPME